MNESESRTTPEQVELIAAELQDERRRRQALEAKVAGLEDQVLAERAKLQRLVSRRSVRTAVRTAKFAAPIFNALRRIRRSPESGVQKASRQDEVAKEICRLRPGQGPTQGPLVTCVVLNRNGAHHLKRLLVGLRDDTIYRSFELVVIDNGSADESIELLDRDWGFPVHTIRNEANVSFSRGCNQGLEVAGGKYILLLNNDVAPINRGWLGSLIEALENDHALGAAGSLLVYPERPGYRSGDPNTGADLTIQHRGIRFQWRRNAKRAATVPWAYNMGVGEDPTDPELATTRVVPAATAACLLISADLLQRLGGLDEAFTYGMEDVDLCLRIRDAGFLVALVGEAALFHHEFGTQSKIESPRRRAFGLANLKHFSEKWGPRLSRELNLEALSTGHLSLHDHPQSRIVLRGDAASSFDQVSELASALTSAGHALGHEDDLGEDVSLVICSDPGFDVRTVLPDSVTIAWVMDDGDRWVGSPWFGAYNIYVPGSATAAATLRTSGIAATAIVPLQPDNARELLAASGSFLLRPRVGINAINRDHPESRALLQALIDAGTNPLFRSPTDWDTPASQCVDIVVHVQGSGTYEPRADHKNVLLTTGNTSDETGDEFTSYDLVLGVATAGDDIPQDHTTVPTSVLRIEGDSPPRFDAKQLRVLLDSLEWEPNLDLTAKADS